ncbi:MAG: hypothetical protein ACOCQ3_03500 [Natronomonas sp.]
MYEETYGTDWEELSIEEALERSYRLGVMAGLERPMDEEYDRVLETAGNAYERNLIEMAFDEGLSTTRSIDYDDVEDVWSETEDAELVLSGVERPWDAPPSSGSPELLDAPASDDRPTNIDLPEFLFR